MKQSMMRAVVFTAMIAVVFAANAGTGSDSLSNTGEADTKEELAIRLIRENGCKITEQQIDPVFDPHFSHQEMQETLEGLIDAGRLKVSGDVLTLVDGGC